MSNIDTINVGGLDYSIEDSTAREEATSAITVSAYVENGNTASRAYPVIGTPVNWKGTLYYTSATIAQGATLSTSNLTAATNLGQYLITRTNRIKTYVGSDSKLHFTDATGADSVLPFNKSLGQVVGTVTFNALSQARTLSVTSVQGWQSLTNNNFYYKVNAANSPVKGEAGDTIYGYYVPVSLTYNASTGVLTVNNGYGGGAGTRYGDLRTYPTSITIVVIKS